MQNQIILTPEGKMKLEVELKELKEIRRPDIITKIEQAKEMGDLSENAEYHDAKDQQGMIESRIAEIEDLLKKASVSQNSISKDIIEIGSSFVVQDNLGVNKTFTLVGYNEAEPLLGKISNVSPVGKAFLGKVVGSSVEVEAPKGIIVYKIIEIK